MTGAAGTGARIVSLVPSITETLLAWGVVPLAVSRFCEVPGIETVGGTKNPEIGAIEALRPDLVLMDEEENRVEDAEELGARGIRVHATRVRSVSDVAGALEAIATLVGAAPSDAAPALPQPGAGPPVRAWVPIWRRPWMTVSGRTYGSSLLETVGVSNVFADSPDPYPQVTIDEVAERRPEVVLAPSEPYPFKERHRPELEKVAPVVFVDGRDLFWWGARTPAAAGRLRALASTLGRR